MASSLGSNIASVVRDLQTPHYSQLSSGSIVVFDHFITFDDEVSLIWNSSWSLGKALFLLNRYYILASVIFNDYSFLWATLTEQVRLRLSKWQGWTGLIACMVAEAILLLRIYALYSLNKKVLSLMLISYVSCFACSAWIMGSVLSSVSASVLIITGHKFCLAMNIPRHFFTFWIPMLSNELLLCTLALFQVFQTFKSGGSMFLNSGKGFFGILIRDSILYFIAIGATYLTCLLIWVLARSSLLEVPIGFSVAMSCVLANRVMFNIRRKYHEGTELTPILNWQDFDS